MLKMEARILAKELKGFQTVEDIMNKLKIGRRTAINYASILRKKGFLKNYGGGRKKRLYIINPIKEVEIGYPDIYEIINKHSRIGLITRKKYRRHDKLLTIEEVIIEATKTKEYRTILAALGLFRKVKNWSLLGRLAIKENMGRKIGALYDVARTILKTKKMDLRTRRSLLNSKVKNKFIIPNLKSKDLTSIEKEWNVHIPFNKADLARYKE